ncbi:MAG: ATP phosphoribosyltransferase [candidate division NC10 bacterium]|nr:ATP phosphoribosyltransferase [candidate division NC10 bacterium]
METPIAIALPKGRLFAEAVALFEAVGITGLEAFRDSRRLIVEDGSGRYRFLALRDADVPTYVEHGAADLGVVGKDQLLEHGRDLYEPLDLRFGACRLVVAQPADLTGDGRPEEWSSLRVATKYPSVTERHFTQRGIQVEIIKLYGSIELAPLVGLAERIVDLVASGRTLREHGLVEVEEIARCSARLIVNRAALKTRYHRIRTLIGLLRARIEQGGR